MSRKLWLCALVLGLALGTARVRAQEQGDSHDDGPPPVDSEESIAAGTSDDTGSQGMSVKAAKPQASGGGHAVGSYAGVEPGGAQAPAVPAAAGQTPAAITWPGFQMRPDGTSRVFVQSTVSVPTQTSASPGKFVVRLAGAQVVGDTNRLALETRFFNTPVTRVSIAPEKDGVSIVLELRAAITPHVSSERGPSGYHFTYIDLPAGKFVEQSAAARAAAEAPLVAAQSPDHMTFLDGNLDKKTKAKTKASAAASTKLDTSMDAELPPGIKGSAKTQPKVGTQTKAQAGGKLGK